MSKPISGDWCIAYRVLLYCPKGRSSRKTLTIRVLAPQVVEPGSVTFAVDEGTAVCTVEFDGLPDMPSQDTYGADSLQALQLAVDVEPILAKLAERYDFYFPSGEPYFES